MEELKISDWRLQAFWFICCASCGLAGFVLGWVWRDYDVAIARFPILNAMTALGTVGSVIAACLFGYRAVSQESSRASLLGEISWKRVEPELAEFLQALRPSIRAAKSLSFIPDEGELPPEHLAVLKDLQSLCLLPITASHSDRLAVSHKYRTASFQITEVTRKAAQLSSKISAYLKDSEFQQLGSEMSSYNLLARMCEIASDLHQLVGKGVLSRTFQIDAYKRVHDHVYADLLAP